MVGEVEGVNFNDPDYNLKEGDEDYHDVVTERRHMKAKDYDDSDKLLEGGIDSENEVEYKEYDAENDNPILEVGMEFASFDQFNEEAFKSGCRPLISLDGCWLKGLYIGNLLAAVEIDPNDCIFHVACVVIADAKSKETWSWFLINLGYDLEITNSHHIAFMSDRQKVKH
ncbi:hypothetical protein KY289_013729 [Solanum tuberosum]|nr:hypothetical protein KY289_013729 [Solanum tuberosum]